MRWTLAPATPELARTRQQRDGEDSSIPAGPGAVQAIPQARPGPFLVRRGVVEVGHEVAQSPDSPVVRLRAAAS